MQYDIKKKLLQLMILKVKYVGHTALLNVKPFDGNI